MFVNIPRMLGLSGFVLYACNNTERCIISYKNGSRDRSDFLAFYPIDVLF